MGLGDHKITDTAIAGKGVVAAPDQLTGTAQENKKVFDRLIREVVKDEYNGLVDELTELGAEKLIQYGSEDVKHIRLSEDGFLETSGDGKAWERLGNGEAGAVKYNVAQSLTSAQKAQAQSNIGTTWPCNPNLLDNWYFGNPVNQRGQTSYNGGGGYGVDRWLNSAGIAQLTIESGYIEVTGATSGAAVDQILETVPQNNSVCTLSALMRASSADCGIQGYSGGEYSSTAKATGIGDWELVKLTFTVVAGTKTYVRFRCAGDASSFDVLAVKLELGNQQTLAHQDADGNWVLNEIPNYAEQLARCQRYYLPVAGNLCPATTIAVNSISFSVATPATMRAIPAIVGSGLGVRSGAGAEQTGFAASVSSVRSNGVFIVASKTAHGLTSAALYAAGTDTAFSADL